MYYLLNTSLYIGRSILFYTILCYTVLNYILKFESILQTIHILIYLRQIVKFCQGHPDAQNLNRKLSL